MHKKMHLIIYPADENVLPLIAILSLPVDVEEEDVHICFSQAITAWKPEMDCSPERQAADRVCTEFNGTVDFVEASQVYGIR